MTHYDTFHNPAFFMCLFSKHRPSGITSQASASSEIPVIEDMTMKYAPILQIVKKPNVQKDIPKSVKDSMKMVNVLQRKMCLPSC